MNGRRRACCHELGAWRCGGGKKNPSSCRRGLGGGVSINVDRRVDTCIPGSSGLLGLTLPPKINHSRCFDV